MCDPHGYGTAQRVKNNPQAPKERPAHPVSPHQKGTAMITRKHFLTGAATATAITAAESGAKVLLAEKAAKGLGGGNSRVCSRAATPA